MHVLIIIMCSVPGIGNSVSSYVFIEHMIPHASFESLSHSFQSEYLTLIQDSHYFNTHSDQTTSIVNYFLKS